MWLHGAAFSGGPASPGGETGLGRPPGSAAQPDFAMDASAYTSRSGPRLVQGLEIIAEILHPELFSSSIPEDGAARVDGTRARISWVSAASRCKARRAVQGAACLARTGTDSKRWCKNALGNSYSSILEVL